VSRVLFGGRAAPPARTMDDFEHWWRVPVQFVLLFFGLANAGVPLSSVGTVTGLVVAGLVIGKPMGIIGTTLLADRLGFERADDLDYRALLVIGIAAGIGFTVALFFTTAAFPAGAVLNEAKMGALLTFFAAPLAILVARMLRIRRT
jgi:NhaA family Na+:H+ antiporter